MDAWTKNMKIKCLIIDDEPLARKRLQSLVGDIPEFMPIGEFGTGKEAVAGIKELRPDFIFLDIQMKDMTGFDVLEQLEEGEQPLVVFVTAYDEYALKAFEFFAFDYLLKPFKKERFQVMAEHVIHHFEVDQGSKLSERLVGLMKYMNRTNSGKNVGLSERIAVRTGRSVSFVEVKDVRYVIASGSYIDIHTDEKTIVHRTSLNQLLEDISAPNLVRIHRSTIINLDAVRKVIRSDSGDFEVRMTDDKLLRVSKSYRNALQIALGIK